MKKDISLAINCGVFLLRCLLTYAAFKAWNPSSFVLGTISLVALLTTVNAWCRGKADLTIRGASVGLLHLVILLLQPYQTNAMMQALLWTWVGFQTVAKIVLAGRTTVTGPVFVSVEEKWPYSMVRHPMTLSETMIAICIALESPSWWNFGALATVLVSKYAIIIAEEDFLMEHKGYQQYASRVKYKLFPGVW